MANVTIIGFVEKLVYKQDCVLLFLSEYKKGYRKNDGTIVDDKYMSWKTIWKPYFKKYLSEHFSDGMLVEVKGEVLPYAIEHERLVDGYSVIGQCCNRFSYPRSGVKKELQMIKESQMGDMGIPDLNNYEQPDF